MDTTIKRATVGAMLCATVTGATAEELKFDNLYIVGDSLSDGGAYSQTVQAGGGGLLPAINYRWLTNAPDGSSRTYGEVLAGELGLDLQPNIISGVPAVGLADVLVGGTNYAQGGSRVTDPAGIGNDLTIGITTLPIAQQVDQLLTDNPSFGDNDLVILWGGANDVFAQSGAVGAGLITPTDAVVNMTQAATEMVAQIDRVRAAGAETIIVVTAPDIGSTPFGLSSGAAAAGLLTGLSDAFNTQLIAGIGSSAVIVDSQKLLSRVQADPVLYGFTAVDAATVPACIGQSLSCIQGLSASIDSETRIFADGVHPTTAAHLIFGQAAFAGLQAATQTGAISVSIMTALRQQSLSIENRMNPTVLIGYDENGNRVRRKVGDIDVFGSVEFGSYEADSQQVTPGVTGSTQVAKLGFDIAVAENATVGLGLSFDKGQVEFDGGSGFDSTLMVGALFGQVALSKAFYLNAAVGGGSISVDDIDRQFNLGPATERYSASSDGSYRFARIGMGGFLPLGDQVLLNPFAHYTYEKVSIDGFTESQGAASLAFGDTEYESRRITAGVSAIISPIATPGWKFNLRGSIEHDLNDDPLSVSLGPNSATLGTVSAPRPDRTWGYLSGSVIKELGPESYLSFTASSSIGQDGTTGYVGALSFKMTF
ncbi:autotransporter domain-containing protein [Puniceibacterium sp. IMCC21224]|uniref:autotransporter domain-containing protein n=1 Tax=Puniceibacterium sp. IMCC21224 TaxID=1618204 RepID=UPI00064D7BC5|nr:autotransporter domain-containing protein [Puniceibacterium sp. IMCC21224]KMK68383.1 phospholipase/lecithinase/hemolysin [Puniceibacterium sp. IMCC21224]